MRNFPHTGRETDRSYWQQFALVFSHQNYNLNDAKDCYKALMEAFNKGIEEVYGGFCGVTTATVGNITASVNLEYGQYDVKKNID